MSRWNLKGRQAVDTVKIVEESVDLTAPGFALAQYQTLRAEVLQLVNMQAQLISLNVLGLGGILSVGVQAKNSQVIMIFPALSFIIGLSWLNHAHSIYRTADFVAYRIESCYISPEIGWETFLRDRKPSLFNRIGFWSVRLVFPAGSMLALISALLIGVSGKLAWIEFSASCAICFLTVLTFLVFRESSSKAEHQNFLRGRPNYPSQRGSIPPAES